MRVRRRRSHEQRHHRDGDPVRAPAHLTSQYAQGEREKFSGRSAAVILHSLGSFLTPTHPHSHPQPHSSSKSKLDPKPKLKRLSKPKQIVIAEGAAQPGQRPTKEKRAELKAGHPSTAPGSTLPFSLGFSFTNAQMLQTRGLQSGVEKFALKQLRAQQPRQAFAPRPPVDQAAAAAAAAARVAGMVPAFGQALGGAPGGAERAAGGGGGRFGFAAAHFASGAASV